MNGTNSPADQETVARCDPVHRESLRLDLAHLPAGGCRSGRAVHPAGSRALFRGHLPAPIRKERAAGAARDLSAHLVLGNECRAGQGFAHLEAPVIQRHAPARARAGFKHACALCVAQGAGLYLPRGFRPPVFLFWSAALEHRRRYRFAFARSGRSAGRTDQQVRQGDRPHGCFH